MELGKDKNIYEKCIGIARRVNGFKWSLDGDRIILTGNGRTRSIPREMFFTLEANEIINLLENQYE